MRTGVSYMGHHNPKHLKIDLEDIRAIDCDDVLLAAQENDFIYKKGMLDFFPSVAKDHGLRPLAIFWGLINYFGGGRSSQFLLEHPQAHQVNKDGSYNPAGCYNNPEALKYVKNMIDYIASLGFEGYFLDEPSLLDCYCASCRNLFRETYSQDLDKADKNTQDMFRKDCVTRYIKNISGYVKKVHPEMETLCCIMPQDKSLWQDVACIDTIDNLGTDIYWVNEDTDTGEMRPLIKELAKICNANNKQHHQWLQCWGVEKGREFRIKEQGDILIEENPDSLYVWAFQGQIGTSESCHNPQKAWLTACDILKQAKGL